MQAAVRKVIETGAKIKPTPREFNLCYKTFGIDMWRLKETLELLKIRVLDTLDQGKF